MVAHPDSHAERDPVKRKRGEKRGPVEKKQRGDRSHVKERECDDASPVDAIPFHGRCRFHCHSDSTVSISAKEPRKHCVIAVSTRTTTEKPRSETTGVLLRLLREDDLPRRHQPGSFSHRSIGVANPSAMDSRMSGTERRYRVS